MSDDRPDDPFASPSGPNEPTSEQPFSSPSGPTQPQWSTYESAPYGTLPEGQAPYGSLPPGQPYGGPAPIQGYYQADLPLANTAFVFGLVGLIGGFFTGGCLALCGPVAWILGVQARRQLRANPHLGGYDKATAGMWMGVAASVVMALGLLVVLMIFGLFASIAGGLG